MMAESRKRLEASLKNLPPDQNKGMMEAIDTKFSTFLSRRVARVVQRTNVPQGKQVLRSRFVLTIKGLFENGVRTGLK